MIIFDLLALAASSRPTAPALTYRDSTQTYGELLGMTEGFAGGLAALKVGKGSRIAVMLPNCPAFVVAYLGASRVGATVVPINVLYRPDEARYILADCGAEVLVIAEAFRPLVQALRPLLPALKHVVMVTDNGVQQDEVDFRMVCAHTPPPRARVAEDSPAVILYTSGTTGRPKGAVLTHHNLLTNVVSCSLVLNVTAQDSFLSALPLFHAFAAMVFLLLPIKVGARMQIMERFVPAHTLQLMATSGASIFGGVPSMFGLMLQVPEQSRPDLSALRLCVSGGAPLPPEIWVEFEETFNAVMVEGYGLTEASPVVAVNPPDGVRKPGSIGLPIPGVEVKILDDHGHALGPGATGELVIRGGNIMHGYLQKPAETREVLKRGWLHTGDLARMDEDGYLYIVGRKKELILVGGLNVYPGEVERVLMEHPAVLEAAAFGVQDASRGEAVWAAVVRYAGQSVTEKELQAFCREKLATYKVPRGIVFRDELPKNALGKVMRHLLHNEVAGQAREACDER